VIKLITGGQTGVDTGAALAGVTEKVPTICYLPKGMKREEPVPDWMLQIASALETDSYAARTQAVTKMATATLVIQPDGDSTPGTALTLREAKDQGNQVWRFMNVADKAKWKAEAHAVAYWLHSLEHLYGEFYLMVAGPRGGKWEDGTPVAHDIMRLVLQELKALKDPMPKKRAKA